MSWSAVVFWRIDGLLMLNRIVAFLVLVGNEDFMVLPNKLSTSANFSFAVCCFSPQS